jgi:hypothetical protein
MRRKWRIANVRDALALVGGQDRREPIALAHGLGVVLDRLLVEALAGPVSSVRCTSP